jgi:membrane fusion protein
MSAEKESALFRAEALAHQSSHLYGRAKLLMPVRYAVAAFVSVSLAASTLAFGYAGQYTKKARVAGLLAPRAGAAKIIAVSGGVVIEKLIAEGQVVEAGQTLFILSVERESEQGETAKLIAQQIDARRLAIDAEGRSTIAQLTIRAGSLAERMIALEREMGQMAAERELQERRVSLSGVTLKRHEDLAAKGFLPAAQVQQKQEEMMEQQARLQATQRNETSLKKERDSLAAQKSELAAQIAGAKEQTLRSLAQLEQERVENSARRRSLVLAPRAGTLTAIAAEPGMTIPGGGTLATLLPQDATLEAQLYVPARAAGFIEPGQRVDIRFETYPYQKFGMGQGTVTDITKSPFALSELPPTVAAVVGPAAQMSGGQGGEAVYRITVQLVEQTIQAYGKPQPLKAGMTVEADVLQDKRRLYEWVLEPVFGFAGRV